MIPITKEAKVRTGIWKGKFIYLWVASTFSSLSISMYLTIEQWYVVNYLNSKSSLGIILMATTIPRVLLMIIGGVVSDKYRRSKIIFFSLLTRCFMLLLMALFYTNNLLSLSALFIFALLFGASDAFFWSARDSIVPGIIHKEQLVRANSVIQTTNQLSVMFGPVLGATLLSLFSYSTIFLIIAFTLLISIILLQFIKEKKTLKPKKTSILRDLAEGINYVKDSSFLLTVMGTFIIVNLFFIGPLMLSIPILAEDRFKGNAFYLSILQSSFASGMLLGAIVMGWLNIKSNRGKLAISFILLEGLLLMIFSQGINLWLAAAILLAIGCCVSGINIPIVSLIQEKTPSTIVGRVMSVNTMVSMGLIPVSYGLVSTLLSINVDIKSILLCAGIVIILFSVLLFSKASDLKKT
ncbi:MFS transporter [Priestia megaterium]|uniref:MFS transporter n=1 Tax=Priestia megaterium TaxID=1404 RepID=UPI00237A13D6|nr:MFS transporter [Priestia megaterium]MDD9791692.1 MFS transporter [Priestia megaterium]